MNNTDVKLTLTDHLGKTIDEWTTELTRVYGKAEEHGELVMLDENVFKTVLKVLTPHSKQQVKDAMLMATHFPGQ